MPAALHPLLVTALGESPRPRARDRVREVANWVNLSTPFGLLVARLWSDRVYRGPRGYWLAEGYRPRVPVAPAFTVGDVLISRQAWPERMELRPELMKHEAAHSWQYVATLGLPFVPLYLATCAWSWVRCGDTGSRNVFEQWAGLRRGATPRACPPAPSRSRRGSCGACWRARAPESVRPPGVGGVP